MKCKPCPWCGCEPDVVSASGIHVTACLECTPKQGAHGRMGGTITESKSAWNRFVVAMMVSGKISQDGKNP
jgi:hypothetical protein